MTNYIPVFILNELVILPGQEIKIDLSNELSKKIIKTAIKNNNSYLVVVSPEKALTKLAASDLSKVGVISHIKSKLELSNGKLRITLRGENRVNIHKYYQNKSTSILKCSYENIVLPISENSTDSAVKRKIIDLIKEYISSNKSVSNSIIKRLDDKQSLDYLTDLITSFMSLPSTRKAKYVKEIDPNKRASLLMQDLKEEIHITNIDKELDEKIQYNLENSQREYILKEKLREINNELGNSKDAEISELISKVNLLNLDEKTSDKLIKEINKLALISEQSPETAVLRNYIETVLSLPWNDNSSEENQKVEIERKLNESHYGLKKVKDRVVEYVVSKNKGANPKTPIICLIGPPGVGKTSIAQSIAYALGRQFYKISVGGLNDSTELIGSRKTYLGAAPGKVIQGIMKCKTNNPVILIDEVDKMVKDYKGDPASTLLEILDPIQNKMFTDNYIEEPFDLSKVMFILTANDEENIPATLLDRLEIFNLSSYSIYEKIDIARNYLIKRILESYNASLKLSKETAEFIIKNYTKEPGVRELNRILETLIRKIIVYEKEPKSITNTLVSRYLDNKTPVDLPRIRDYGIVNILSCSAGGGEVSHVEVARMKGTGKVIVTGNTGSVLNESAIVAKTYLTSTFDLETMNEDVHVHFLYADQKKDGPSAGAAIATAFLSMFKRRLISDEIAITGEITVKGNILPVGGIKEKLIAASYHGIKTAFIPKDNENDLMDIPDEVFENVAIKLVSNFSEIYDALF